jgi:hypothetical protein
MSNEQMNPYEQVTYWLPDRSRVRGQGKRLGGGMVRGAMAAAVSFQIRYDYASEPPHYVAVIVKDSEEMARRVAACWNRLAPFTTEEIENGIDLVALHSRLTSLEGVLRGLLPPEGMEGWWCPSCKSEVDATYHEHCATCGTYIGDKQPSTDWIKKARATLSPSGPQEA